MVEQSRGSNMAVAAQTQRQREAQLGSRDGCVHEQLMAMSYERERRRIQALCLWMAPDTAAARRLSMQVFLEAWRQPRPEAQGPESERDWLTAVFAAQFKTLFRDGRRCSPDWDADTAGAGSAAATTRAAVRALPEPERLLYLLHDGEGYDAAILAAWLGLEHHRCAQWIHQARRRMCRSLCLAA